MIALFRRLWARIHAAATRPMTQHEFDSVLAMSGGKRCPHCREWL